MGYSPLGAGLRTLPWTVMPMIVAPIAGPLSDRIGGRPLMITGLTLMTAGLLWMRADLAPDTTFLTLMPSFIVSGIGMALFFIPVANVVMGSVPSAYEGVASGTNNAVREVGGVFGVAVLASVFAAAGGYANAADFTHGLHVALLVGAAVTGAAALGSLLVPGRRTATATEPIGGYANEPALGLDLKPAEF